MKGSLLVLSMFFVGCVLGYVWNLSGWELGDTHHLSMYILYALMFQVGVSIGGGEDFKELLRGFRPKMLLIPLATIGGTLLFSALVSVLLTRWSVFDCLAVGSGLGYYSLSSILIMELKTPDLGAQLATELATIALLTNVIRELVALVGAPFICKYFGKLAPISVAGVTSVDVALPPLSVCLERKWCPLPSSMDCWSTCPCRFSFLCFASCRRNPPSAKQRDENGGGEP